MNRAPTPYEEENQWLLGVVKTMFNEFQGIYGYRRLTMNINRRHGTQYNHKRIRRLLIKLGLRSYIRRSNGYCTKTSYQNIEANHLNGAFTATAPNEKWLTDVTYLKYGIGQKAYLSAIKDVYDGSIVAYKLRKRNDNPLVMDTLKDAIEMYPDATPMIHSDRGSQYTSKAFRQITTEAGMTRSMSRLATCTDNAPMESFFGHFKCECYDLKMYTTFETLEADIEKYIKFYNHDRFQAKLNSLSPMEFRAQAAA